MKRISYGTLSMVTGVVYLGLITNVLLIVAAFPLVALLITSDPARSWPLLALAAPLCAPAISAAFVTFRDYSHGGITPARTFLAGWLATWRRAATLGVIATGIVVVLLVDVRFFAGSAIGVAIVPVIGVIAAIVVAVTLVSLVAISESPKARLRDVIKASLYLGVRRWYLTLVSLAVLATQAALFTSLPAIALGLTATPALYLAWANSRYSLRPVLILDEVPAH
jgi:uncharacterized membrane protein YesL